MDIQTIIYLIFFIIFIVSRIMRARKKQMEQNGPPPAARKDYSEPVPQVPEKEEPSFQDIFTEMMKNFEDEERPKKAPHVFEEPVVEAEPLAEEGKGFISDEEEARLKQQEGIMAFRKADLENYSLTGVESTVYDQDDDDITQGELMGDEIDDVENQQFQFDPREAFMMKTLLERPYK